MKKLLLDIHIYSSLLCASYLVIYGVSTISFNHRFQPATTSSQWQRAIEVPTGTEDDRQLAEAVRDRLGLSGWLVYWRMYRDSATQLRFEIQRPTRTYIIQLDQATGRVEVEEKNSGIWGAIRGLHGMTGMPNSTWASTWGIYTELSTLALFFAALSGVYFWWGRAAERRAGLWFLALGSGLSLLFVLYVVW